MRLPLWSVLVAIGLCAFLALSALFTACYWQPRWEENVRERKANEPLRRTAVLEKARQLGEAVRRYLAGHRSCLPHARNWEQALLPYLPAGFSFELPAVTGEEHPRRFAMNEALDGVDVTSISTSRGRFDTVLFFESSAAGPSPADHLASLPPSDGVTGYIVVISSGMAHYLQPSDREGLLQRADPNRGMPGEQ